MQASTPLGASLAAIASSGAINLAVVSAQSMSDVFLPHLMPAAFKGQQTVPWHPQEGPAAGADNASRPSRAALLEVWALLEQLPDLAPLSPWPLLPVHGGLLCQLSTTSAVRCLPSTHPTLPTLVAWCQGCKDMCMADVSKALGHAVLSSVLQ